MGIARVVMAVWLYGSFALILVGGGLVAAGMLKSGRVPGRGV